MSDVSSRFFTASNAVMGKQREYKGIGTLSEKTLHAVLKHYYEPDISKHEQRAFETGERKFIADILSEKSIIEIQTRSFNAMREKLELFLQEYDVTVVYPIAQKKWLCWLSTETGELSKKRKSPRVGRIYDIIPELYKIKYLLINPKLSFRILLMEITEYRLLNGWSSDKKKGSSRCERIPNAVFSEVEFGGEKGYSVFIPMELSKQFTAKDFSKTAKISVKNAQITLNILTHTGTVIRVGKNGNQIIYSKITMNQDDENYESRR